MNELVFLCGYFFLLIVCYYSSWCIILLNCLCFEIKLWGIKTHEALTHDIDASDIHLDIDEILRK